MFILGTPLLILLSNQNLLQFKSSIMCSHGTGFESANWRAALNFLTYFCSEMLLRIHGCDPGISIGEWSLSGARCMDNSRSSFSLKAVKMPPGMYLPAYISLNIGSSFFLVHLIHYILRTAEWNIDSSRLEQGITPIGSCKDGKRWWTTRVRIKMGWCGCITMLVRTGAEGCKWVHISSAMNLVKITLRSSP